jgi:hypothetical protein
MAAQRTADRVPDDNALPTVGFSRVVQLHLPTEDVHLVHDHDASTDADIIVHFETAGVLMLGGVFTSDGYPVIDTARGGKIDQMINWVDWFCNAFVRGPHKLEPIIPGRGPPATFQELVDYRDMLVSVRDRVRSLMSGDTPLTAIIAARPTAAFDQRWGRGPVSPDDFVRMVYESLKAGAR